MALISGLNSFSFRFLKIFSEAVDFALYFSCTYSWTPVHCAASYGNISVLEYMLKERFGISVNIKVSEKFEG